MSSDDKNFTFWKKYGTNRSLLVYFESRFVSGSGSQLVTVIITNRHQTFGTQTLTPYYTNADLKYGFSLEQI